ncbi:hypothetical protein LguiB_001153 [Lonicera macranthoides]
MAMGKRCMLDGAYGNGKEVYGREEPQRDTSLACGEIMEEHISLLAQEFGIKILPGGHRGIQAQEFKGIHAKIVFLFGTGKGMSKEPDLSQTSEVER